MKKYIVGLVVCLALGFMSLLTSSASAQFVYSGTMAKEVLVSHHAVGNTNYSNAGDTVWYSISYTNNSTGPVVMVLNDSVPSNLIVTAFLTSLPGCTLSISTINILSSNGCTVLPGQTAFFSIVTIVAPNAIPYNRIINTGTVTVYNPSNLTTPITIHTSSVSVFPYPRLSVNKILTGNPPQIGASGVIVQGNTTYQISMTNSGSVTATGIVLSDNVPFGFTISSITPVGASPILANPIVIIPTNTYIWSGLTIPANTTYTYNVTLSLNNILALPGQPFTNTGVIATGSAIPGAIITTGVSPVTSTILGMPALSMTKTIISPNASGHVHQSGDLVTYQIMIVNTGTAIATGLVVDTLPLQLTYVSSSLTPTSIVGQTITWSGFAIPAGGTGIITLTARLNANHVANTLYANNSAFTCQSPLICNNVTASVVGRVLGFGAVQITKAITSPIGGNLSRSGDMVTYQVTIANTGTAVATGDVSDLLPSELTYVSATIAPTTILGQTITRTNFAVNPGQPRTITITARLNSNYSAGTQYVNNADFTCVSPAVCTVIDNGTATGTIVGFGSVGIVKAIVAPNASGHISQVGDLVTYEITLTNTGTASVTGTITDIWPIHLNYISSSIPQSSVVGQTITWSGFTIPAGGTSVITLTGRLNSNYPANTPYINTVTYTCLSPSVCNNATSSVTGTIVGFSAVSMTKTIIAPNASGHVSGSGDLVTYRITVSNTGTAGVTGRINDTFPGELTYLTSSVSPFIGGTNNFFVPASGSFSIIVTGVVNNNYSGGTLYVNTADFICQVSLVPCTNISATATGTIVGFGAVSIIKDITSPNTSGAISQSGQMVMYAVTIFNTGTSAITGTFVDVFPPQLSILSISVPATISGQMITISGLNIAAGQSYPMLITGVLNGTYPANTLYTNTATYACTSPSVCNNATASATGIILGFGSVSMTKTIISPNASGHVSGSGDLVTYQIAIINTGNSTVTGFLTDIWPTHLNFISSNPSVASGATGLLVSIPASGSFVVTVTGVLNANYSAGTLYTNTANFSCQSPSICNNATATVTGLVLGFGNVILNKTIVGPNTGGYIYQSGDIVDYQITLINTGTTDVTGTLTDLLPTHLNYINSFPLASTTGSITTWTGLFIPASGSLQLNLKGILNANYISGTLYVNDANFACQSPLVCHIIDNGTATGIILGLPNLTLTKTILSGGDAVMSGDAVSYLLSLVSSGATSARSGDRCITDTFPSQVNYFTSSIAPLTVATGGCPIGSRYGTGVPATIILTGRLNDNYPIATIVTNTGSVSSLSTIELFTGDNVDTASFAIGVMAEMALTKTMTGAINGISGTIVTYTLSYANHGTTGASNVVIYDTLPSVFTYLGTISGGTGVASGNLITWNIGSVPAGASGNVVFQAYYNQFVASGIITNTGLVTTTTRDIDFSTDNALHTFSIAPLPEVEIIKTILNPGQPLLGSPISFMLTVINHGAVAASGIVIQDILPSSITYVSHTSNMGPGVSTLILGMNMGPNNTLTSDPFNLAPGQSGFITLTGYLNTQPLTGISYTNTGIVTGVVSVPVVRSTFTDADWSNNVSTVTGTLIPQIGCNLVISGSAPRQTSYGLDLSGQQVNLSYTLTLSGNVPLSGGTLTTTRPNSLTRPINLPTTNNIATGITLSGTSVSSWNLTGITTNRSFTSLNVSGVAQFSFGGSTFSCTTTTSLVPPLGCNNGYLNQGEQCDVLNYNNQTYTTVLPGIGFDATTQACNSTCQIVTTSVNNCATIVAAGGSQTSCAIVSSTDPVLTLDKSVSPSTNLSVGSTLTYTVVVTNTSNQTAYNVQFSDTFPRSHLNYVGPVSITPASYNGLVAVNTSLQSFSGNLGTIAPGQSVTISFPATVSSVPSNNTITNTALVQYTNAVGSPMPPLTDSVSVTLGTVPQGACLGTAITTTYPYLQNGQASVTVRVENPAGSSAALSINCNNGSPVATTIGTNFYATCQYTTVGQQPTITMSVNGMTSPSCAIPVTIRQNTANRCGDGYISIFEQCDMGNNSVTYNGGIIGDYLDRLGMTMPSGQYRGRMCSSSCEIQGSTVAVPACRYTDTTISVMEGEYLPFAWDVEVNDNSIVESCSGAPDGSILRSSMICDFKMFNKNEEATNNQTERKTVPCAQMLLSTKQWNNLFEDMDPPFVQDPFGTQIFNITKTLVNGGYGEYKVSLDKVQYKYCKNGVAIQGNPYARVCQVNFAVTKPYMMVKTPVTQRPSDTLDDYFVLGSDTQTIISASEFDRYNTETSLTNLSRLTASMNTMVDSLIAKYEKLAKTVSDSSITVGQVKKVPGKSFYIINGDSVFEPGDEYTVPTTVVVKGDLTIVGDVPVNMLLIATGKITINAADDNCDTQMIRGIIVAKGGFTKSSSSTRWNTLTTQGNPKNTKRCAKGNVHVYGVLYGPNVDNLVQSRRSHLEHWFTTERGVNTDAELKAERRDEIYQGASVYVEQNASLWRSMPPGADEFLKALQVARY